MVKSSVRHIAIQRMKTVKSAYILEADALAARGLETAAMALFMTAAERELELAETFESRSDRTNAQLSRFSAASCLYRAQ